MSHGTRAFRIAGIRSKAMKSYLVAMCLLTTAALLSGCDRSPGPGGESSKDPRLWATDACKTFPPDAAGKAAGIAVTAAVPDGKSTVSGMQVSTCTYEAAGSGSFTIAMRYQGEAGSMRSAIAGLNAAPDVTGPIVEVPVKQGKAFWGKRYRTLSLIPDEKRVVVVTPPGVSGADTDANTDHWQQTALRIAQAAAASWPQPGDVTP